MALQGIEINQCSKDCREKGGDNSTPGTDEGRELEMP